MPPAQAPRGEAGLENNGIVLAHATCSVEYYPASLHACGMQAQASHRARSGHGTLLPLTSHSMRLPMPLAWAIALPCASALRCGAGCGADKPSMFIAGGSRCSQGHTCLSRG